MSYFDFCIYFTISLTGVAYPLLLQVIARLDDKYTSHHIVELFKKERIYWSFRFTLYCLIVFIIFRFSNLEAWFNFDGWDKVNFIINNSAIILVSICNCLLLIFFFLLVKKY